MLLFWKKILITISFLQVAPPRLAKLLTVATQTEHDTCTNEIPESGLPGG